MAEASTTMSKKLPTSQEIAKGISRLEECIAELQAFNLAAVGKVSNPDLTALSVRITDTLRRCFGAGSASFSDFSSANLLQSHSAVVREPVWYRTQAQNRIARSIKLLQAAQRVLQEDLSDLEASQERQAANVEKPEVPSNRVFVVHGHDDAALQGLARFLEKLGLEAIILKEQPDQGRTIIEKFESSADDVGFAVVLLTPDDIGGAVKAERTDARARQNVIFELGYFAGKLGRGRVCLLRKGSVEIPSDLYGVIYTEMDSADGWKSKLVGELKAAKLDFDANKFWS